MKDRSLLVKFFYKNDDCVLAALKKFRSLRGMKKCCDPMSAKGFQKMIKKFEETGSFAVKSGRGRKSVALTSVEDPQHHRKSRAVMCKRAVHERIARSLDMPESTRFNMLAVYSKHLLKQTILLVGGTPQQQKVLKSIGLPFQAMPLDFTTCLDENDCSSPVEFVEEVAKQKALEAAEKIQAGIGYILLFVYILNSSLYFYLSWLIPSPLEVINEPSGHLSEEEISEFIGPSPKKFCKSQELPDLIIAAERFVHLDGEIIRKAQCIKDSIDMITKLNGKSHTVLTGVALIIYDKRRNDAQKYQSRTFFGATEVKMAELTGDIIEVYANTADVINKAGGYIYEDLGCSLVEEISGDYFNAIGLPARKLANEIFELCQADVL
ncbi:hypothetical protein CDAR_529301 [Caerostris darwini]|uniref:Maf-like protein n=1 Tax=Caerostris darwini TaxID=1538125 RepID=A0AAV4TYI5_9ARAC|nr:hypothetical protein CDAR_529301 [Caerostris darwini]